MVAPKLFISYCWSDVEHEKWVLDLATDLRESGVDVILDKWDLKEGHDAIAFMEQMVSNPEIKKVAIICEEKYASKADGRAGGVGTETQIISKEVYDNQAQEKFVAIVKQKDGNGKPFLPIYYKSRIFIDLSEEDKYSENFERLQRWIFDKPLYIKPEIGNKPNFLSEGEHISLGSSVAFKRCIDAIKNQKPIASGVLDEYLKLFSTNLERFRIDQSKIEGEFDDAIVKSIEEFLPCRNEIIQLFITIAQFSPTHENIKRIHRFFESLIPYTKYAVFTPVPNPSCDNFKFIVHELFLYTIGVFLKYELIEQTNQFLETEYFFSRDSVEANQFMVSFKTFDESIESLKKRNTRLNLGRLSIRSDLLKDRSTGLNIEFQYFLLADFVAFMRTNIQVNNKRNGVWYPHTLLLLGKLRCPFEIFARASSKAYFEKIKTLLLIKELKDLNPLIERFSISPESLPEIGNESFSPELLLGFDNLARRP